MGALFSTLPNIRCHNLGCGLRQRNAGLALWGLSQDSLDDFSFLFVLDIFQTWPWYNVACGI